MIRIEGFRPHYYVSADTVQVAKFDVFVGDIRFIGASLRYFHRDGMRFYLSLPGNKAGVRMDEQSRTRRAILRAAMARYRAYQDAIPLEGAGGVEIPADG